MSNPYKFYKHQTPFPDDLSSQLKKLEYLSTTTISMLNFQAGTQKDFSSENMLLRMKVAGMQQ